MDVAGGDVGGGVGLDVLEEAGSGRGITASEIFGGLVEFAGGNECIDVVQRFEEGFLLAEERFAGFRFGVGLQAAFDLG